MSLLTNLISYWKLDEASGNVADSVGSNPLTNTSMTFGAGKINNCAIHNNSVASYFAITDAAQSGLAMASDFSISFWWNVAAGSDGERDFFCKFGASGDRGFRAYHTQVGAQHDLECDISSNGTAIDSYNSSYAISGAAAWRFIVFTWKASTSKGNWYVNGSTLGEVTGSATSIHHSTQDFLIGIERTKGNINANQKLDEFGIWARVLTATEVTTLYNAGAGLPYPFTLPVTSNASFLLNLI